MSKQIPWLRVLVESVLIVISILLAFGIQAWWDGRRERVEEQQLLTNLHEELGGARVQVLDAVEYYREAEERGIKLAEFALSDNPDVPPDLLALLWSTLVDISSAHFETDVLDGMLASGRLELIGNDELRELLGGWPRIVGEFTEQEVFIRNFTAANDPILDELPDMAALWLDPPGRVPAERLGRPEQAPSPDAIRFVRSTVGRSMVAHGTRLQLLAGRDAELVLTAIDRLLDLIEGEMK